MVSYLNRFGGIGWLRCAYLIDGRHSEAILLHLGQLCHCSCGLCDLHSLVEDYPFLLLGAPEIYIISVTSCYIAILRVEIYPFLEV